MLSVHGELPIESCHGGRGALLEIVGSWGKTRLNNENTRIYFAMNTQSVANTPKVGH